MKIDFSKTAIENCPSFDKCQINACPLHPDYSKLKDYECDKKLYNWKPCKATKYIRMKIAKAFKLKSLGLTLRELGNLRKSIRMKKQYFSTRVKNLKIEKQARSQGVSNEK